MQDAEKEVAEVNKNILIYKYYYIILYYIIFKFIFIIF